MSVVTVAQVKTHLNITVTTHDAELQTFIDAAEAAIAEKIGPLAATATTSRVRGDGREKLPLPVPPVRSLTSVTPVGGTALTVGDLMVQANVVEYIEGGSFGSRWYDVVYSAGHAADAASVPANLLLAVKELVRALFKTQRGGAKRPGSPDGETYANSLVGVAHSLMFEVERLLPATQGFA